MTVLLFVIGYAFFHPRIRLGQRLMELPSRSAQATTRLLRKIGHIAKRFKEEPVVSTNAIPNSEQGFNEGPNVGEFSGESSCEAPQINSKLLDSTQLRQRLP